MVMNYFLVKIMRLKDDKELEQLLAKTSLTISDKAKKQDKPATPHKRHKYGAKAVVVDNIRFQSTLESRYYQYLKQLKESGLVHHFHCGAEKGSLTINLLACGYKPDFIVFYTQKGMMDLGCPAYEYIDTKGKMTPEARIKLKEVEVLYQIKVKLVYDGDF